jgi:hypothetical protein
MVKITGVGALTLYVLILKLQPALERFHIIDVITEKYICNTIKRELLWHRSKKERQL